MRKTWLLVAFSLGLAVKAWQTQPADLVFCDHVHEHEVEDITTQLMIYTGE